MANRLAKESSDYLLKHSTNPVDWFPWSDEAFELAKKLDKPLFISIGYFSCHWCSVMERESFTDNKTANFMNKHFINIKVDREEMPDIDKIYQRYYNTLTGSSGGWPLNIYAFPDGLPFYIVTYLPKNFSLRSKTFMALNKEIISSWDHERAELMNIGTALFRNLENFNKFIIKSKAQIDDEFLVDQIIKVQKQMDLVHGGISIGSTKFPRFSLLRYMLKEGHIRNNDKLMKFVEFTFTKMSQGGIYDQIRGGLCRYSVDRKWTIPHFEKMLYDQAGWLRLASDLYSLTKNKFYYNIILDTIYFLQNEMLDANGAFYSSIDAETNDIEGEYYAFTLKDIKNSLKSSNTEKSQIKQYLEIATIRYGLTKNGNFSDPSKKLKGANILNIKKSISEISKIMSISDLEVQGKLEYIKTSLYNYQNQRIKPGIDTKQITAWNAMLATSLFETYQKTSIESALSLSLQVIDFLLNNHLEENNLIRSTNPKIKVDKKILGVLDDYAFFIEALITGFEVTDNSLYLNQANKVLKLMNYHFYNTQDQIYYFNNKHANINLGNIIAPMDHSFQSSISVQVLNLLKLGKYLDDELLITQAQNLLLTLSEVSIEYPGSMPELLISAGYFLRYPSELIIINDTKNDIAKKALSQYLPEKLVYRWPRLKDTIKWSIIEGKDKINHPAIYLCEDAKCSLPFTNINDFMNYYLQTRTKVQ